jgi:hypothetical protein
MDKGAESMSKEMAIQLGKICVSGILSIEVLLDAIVKK